MADKKATVKELTGRVQYLEEINRLTLEALDVVASLFDFQKSIKNLETQFSILEETRNRACKLIPFKITAFLLVNEDNSEFYLSECAPKDKKKFIQGEVDHLIENGTFAWGLREKRPVIVASKNYRKRLVLHVMTTSSRTRGMFIGVLNKDEKEIPQSSLSLLSIVMQNGANALESFELYNIIRDSNINLEKTVEKRTEQLSYRVDFENLIAHLSTTFINLPPDDIALGLRNALEEIGKFFQADHGFILILSKDGTISDELFEWKTNSFNLPIGELRGAQFEDFPLLAKAIRRSENIYVPSIPPLPPIITKNIAVKDWQNPRSLILVPLISGNTVMGVLGFDSNDESRAWSDSTAGLIKIVGDMFVNALDRKRSEEERRAVNENLRREIAERMRIQEELKDAKEIAESASLAKSEFVANISHEIRTPLSGIIGMTELIADSKLDKDQRELFHTINSEANTLHNLINDTLDFSKIEAGKLELEEISFDLRALIEDVCGIMSHRAIRKGLECISYVSPRIPKLVIGDSNRLRQILNNLAGNSLKFTSRGEISIKAEVDSDSDEGLIIRFFVIDTGIGIPKDKLETIFDSFTQADGSTSRKFGGSGLGTTISKQLAELMGGEIGAESDIGKGSTFWFTARFTKPTDHVSEEPVLSAELKDRKILVAETNQTCRSVLVQYLQSWGCIPVEASDEPSAVSLLEAVSSSGDPFDVILSEFKFSEPRRFNHRQGTQSSFLLNGTPAVKISAAGSLEDIRELEFPIFTGQLVKPVKYQDLRASIESALGISKDPDGLKAEGDSVQEDVVRRKNEDIHILLAEDYPTNQMVVLRHLKKSGFIVDLAEDGQQAIEAFKRKTYDLILMDIQMPVKDGLEATAAIREWESDGEWQNKGGGGQMTEDSLSTETSAKAGGKSEIHNPKSEFKRVPIIAITAHAVKGYINKCLESGMDDYLTKPLRRNQLLDMIKKWTS